jgi:hypothetical protein
MAGEVKIMGGVLSAGRAMFRLRWPVKGNEKKGAVCDWAELPVEPRNMLTWNPHLGEDVRCYPSHQRYFRQAMTLGAPWAQKMINGGAVWSLEELASWFRIAQVYSVPPTSPEYTRAIEAVCRAIDEAADTATFREKRKKANRRRRPMA